ncbi:MAG: carbohydrate-binding domain-containing protein [Ruminococcus sp.]|nr:carbohydrate-binding domain-containing protein [Ruminococcus sp.]
MKRSHLCAGLLSACLIASATPIASSAARTVPENIGDVNGDGRINVADSVSILQYIANAVKYPLADDQLDRADVCNRGDSVTGMDAVTIQKYDAGVIRELPESWLEGYEDPTEPQPTEPQPTQPEPTQPPVELEDVETKIKLNGSSITVDGKYAVAEGSKVTISHSGSYYIDGKLNDGQIWVEVPDENADPGTVKLIFNGVDITGKSAPAIFVKNAEKTSITVSDGTENSITDGETAYSGDYLDTALIEAKDDLTIKGGDLGTGILNITANTQNAIICNNDVKITGGNINITTLNETDKTDAIKGKTSVNVKGGKITIDSEGDGIKSSKGNVEISDGTIVIKAGSDAIQAETELLISGGDIQACGDKGITCKEGTINITGGELLATASDNQCETLSSTDQAAIVLDFTKQWSKNNPIAVTDSSKKVVFDKNTLKKYRYAIVSSPSLSSGTSYRVYAGGIETLASADIKAGTPAAYTNVNNTDSADLLYGDLFDQSKIHRIEVEMDGWDNFLSHSQDEEYYPCNVIVDGVRIDNVGIRTKGHSSNMFVYQAGKDKYSFRIKFDKYDKYQNYKGLTEICVNNFYSDPSCMRDVLCYNAMYDLDAYAPNVGYTDMYLNGQLYSFYLLCEQPGTTVGERLATNDDAVFYKAADVGNSYDCTFRPQMALNNFEVKWGTDDELKHIADLKDAINKVTSSNYKFIEDYIDVDSWLKGFAVNAVMANYDSYNGQMAHNYYVEYNEGKMYYVGWDYNLSVGNFMDYGAAAESDITTGLYQADASQRPMLTNLLQVPEYREKYYDYVKQIVRLYSDPEKTVNGLATLIRDHVKADPRFFFTYDQFETNIAKSANGIQSSGGNNGGGMWGGGGWGGGGFGGGWGGGMMFPGMGGGLFSYGGDQVSIVDFMIKRNEYIHNKLGF